VRGKEMTQQIPPLAKSPTRSRNIGIIALIIGLVVGLAFGIGVSFLFNLSSSVHTGVGVNNQVQVSGTVPATPSVSTLYFRNSNGTMETSAQVINGQYSVLLVGGQSYEVFDYVPPTDTTYAGSYYPFYVPLGVTSFTENLAYR
jgi:hypothetical protein